MKARGCEGQGAFVIFVFSDCELDLDRFELRRAGQLRPVEPQVFDLLAVLIRERHRDDGRSQRLIRTAHGRGYQFAAPVDEAAQPDPVASLSPTPPAQEIRLTPAGDGIRLAYAISGAGPRLVKAANWLSHLAYDWESPVWRHWLAELSSRFRLVRYDERGCGLSDWDIGPDHEPLPAAAGTQACCAARSRLGRVNLTEHPPGRQPSRSAQHD